MCVWSGVYAYGGCVCAYGVVCMHVCVCVCAYGVMYVYASSG